MFRQGYRSHVRFVSQSLQFLSFSREDNRVSNGGSEMANSERNFWPTIRYEKSELNSLWKVLKRKL